MKRQRIKYLSPEVFAINNEMLIFEDTVAIYRLKPSPLYIEITDTMHADSMRAMFDNLWLTGDSLLLAPDGNSLSKQYLPLNSEFDGVPVVIYPAKTTAY